MARPSKIREKHIEILNDYIQECSDEDVQLEKSSSTTQHWGSESWENRVIANVPTYAELLNRFADEDEELDIEETTLHQWSKKWKELLSSEEEIDEKDLIFVRFSKSLRKLKRKQETMLLRWGLSNTYNPTIAKLVLSSNHGYAETQKVEASGSLKIEVSKEQKEKIASRILAKLTWDKK